MSFQILIKLHFVPPKKKTRRVFNGSGTYPEKYLEFRHTWTLHSTKILNENQISENPRRITLRATAHSNMHLFTAVNDHINGLMQTDKRVSNLELYKSLEYYREVFMPFALTDSPSVQAYINKGKPYEKIHGKNDYENHIYDMILKSANIDKDKPESLGNIHRLKG